MPQGPLEGVRVLELAGIGPSPFTAMLFADMGADVLRVERKGGGGLLFPAEADPTRRGRATIAVDLKHPEGVELVLSLAEKADALIEGYRPGVLERLGLGPEQVHARNPRLVFGRMTGYGQDGPMSAVAGHDINYISLAGALGAMSRKGDRPLAPLNLVGDYGGGGMLLAFGIVCALLEARGSGQGQVVDAAMVEGTALLTTLFYGLRHAGGWNDEPGTNLLDSGAHFYEVYAASDGGHVAVGAIEPQFYARLLELLELDPNDFPQFDNARWPEFKERFAAVIAAKTRAEWAELLEGEEACATAVYSFTDAHEHPHNQARGTFVELDGMLQPAAAPRFDRTPGQARPRRDDGVDALAGWGDFDVAALRDAGALG
jgi:alpha-methylacyl-CoA racemase